MTRKMKFLLLSLICLISVSLGIFFILVPPSFTTDAKTVSAKITVSAEGGALSSALDATKNTLTKKSDGYTYTLYGPNASFSIRFGIRYGGDNFEWGEVVINSSSTSSTASNSSSHVSAIWDAYNVFIEGFRSAYYNVSANVYKQDGGLVRQLNSYSDFDSNRSIKIYDDNKKAHFTGLHDLCHASFYVTPKSTTAHSYRRRYNPVKGTSDLFLENIAVDYGEVFRMCAVDPGDGYHFQEWRDSTGTKLSTFQNNADVVAYALDPYYYAYCPANTYTVVYDKNASSATGSMSNSSFTYDVLGTLRTNSFSRPGYTFSGWSPYSSAFSPMYSNGQTVENLTTTNNGIVRLYAVWTANPYTLTANANGGSIPSSSGWSGSNTEVKKTVYFDDVYGPLPTPSKIGYNFDGWYTAASGGTEVISTTTMTSLNAKIYAHWSAKSYYVVLNKYDGTGGTDSITAYYDQPMPSIAIPNKKGYNFKGYYWNQNGTGTQYFDADGNSVNNWDKDYNTSIEAYWTPKSYQVSYNPNGGTGSMTSRHFNFGEPTQLAANTYTRIGYTFMGWSENRAVDDNYDATVQAGKVNYANQGYLTLTEEAGKELYAVWRNNKYFVRYNANGTTKDPVTGTTNNSTHYYNIASNLANNGYSRRGYSFIGWSTNPNATTASQCISSVKTLTTTDNSTVNLYAIWSRNTYTISFNSNGGTGTTNTLSMLYNNGEYTLPNCGFTKVGYLFSGWMKKEEEAKNDNIKDVDFKNGAKVNSYDFVSDTTLYAKWQATWIAEVPSNYSFAGEGTASNPYKISSAIDLAFLAKNVCEGNTYYDETEGRKHFEQTKPIDLSKNIWTPIGGSEIESSSTAFGGYYDGNGFAIIGLHTYNHKDADGKQLYNSVGLFGRTDGATLINVYLTNAKVVGKNNVGGLVGENIGKPLIVEKCFVSGDVDGLANVGGLVGKDDILNLRILNSGFAGDVNGGSIIVGTLRGATIKNCYGEVSSDIVFAGDGAEIDACVFQAGENKLYYDDISPSDGYFSGWVTYDGKPLPSGITWIGGVPSGDFSLDGYTKVE